MRNVICTILTAAALISAGVAVAGATPAPLSTPELKQTIGSNGKATLVFFQNPYGGPCKAQKAILDKLLQDKKAGFNIVSVNAMNQNDQKAFYDYGVRSLPSLVLVDKNGTIGRVFPPGIQTNETLTSALDRLK